MTTWHRALDAAGQYFTIALDYTDPAGTPMFAAYFPNILTREFIDADGGVSTDHTGAQVSLWREAYTLDQFDTWKRQRHIVEPLYASTAQPGRYFPRMHRGPEGPARDAEAYRTTVRVARSLSRRLTDIFQVVDPARAHADVFGHELRQLLILACTEVESAWQSVLRANAYPGDRWTTRDYVKLLAPMRLDHFAVRLVEAPAYGEIRPFRDWSAANPTASLPWYGAYNATKHNREAELNCATLDATAT